MTTVLIPREPIPFALTAEQVVAYLLRPGSGWREDIGKDAAGHFRRFKRGDETVSFAAYGRGSRHARLLPRTILVIARAESRPAEQVAADIAGPAVGTVGVGCGDKPAAFTDEWRSWVKCRMKSATLSDRVKRAENVIAFAMLDWEDVAPRAPEVE